MQPTFVKTEDAALEKSENEVTVALLHKTELLRFKNWLRSPLLRLPVETITHILSYIMEDMEHPHVWRPTFSTCSRIHTIMCTTTELWRKANFTLDRAAPAAFVRSRGNLQEITVDLARGSWRDEWTRKALGICRDNLAFRGDKLHTVDLCGFPTDVVHWSWIFERPLPRLRNLRIHFTAQFDEWNGRSPSNPVVLELPTELPLQVLDLRNAMLPWSSSLFTGLIELHLAFGDWGASVEISEDELLGIFEASPQLERLSLEALTPKIPTIDGQPQYTPIRIARLPNLVFLKLDDPPEYFGYILSHMDIPAITSLEIRSQLSFWEVERCLGFFFPDDRLPNRLFPNPPVFEVWPASGDGMYNSLNINVGSTKMQFDFDIEDTETSYNAVMTYIHSLIPSSVTNLRLDYSELDEEEWEVFFDSHPEVRSIESTESAWDPVCDSLWDVLSTGPGRTTLCPNLESISIFKIPASTSLLDCLRNRKNAGFGLMHLKLWGVGEELAGEFRLLVEELQVFDKPVDPWDKVCLIPMDELDVY